MAQSKLKFAVIIINVVVFLATITFSQLSSRRSDLFPVETGEANDRTRTEISPAAATFILWAFIYLYQAVWIVYSLSLLWRGDGSILPVWFYLSYSLANISTICWLFVWARAHYSLAFAILALTGISLQISLYFAFTGLHAYLCEFPNSENLPNRVDVWCVRFLVQNGVIFYTTWISIATCLNLCIVLQNVLEFDGSKSAFGVLAVLLVLICVWFCLENTIFEKYTRFVFVEYIVLLVGLSGILSRHWEARPASVIFVLCLLILCVLLFIARLIIIILKERRNVNNGISLRYIVRR